MGAPEMADDERFADNQSRCANVDVLDARVGAWIGTLTLAEADRILAENEIPAGPILDIAQITDHPQIQARHAVQMIPDGDGPAVASYRAVPRFGERPMVTGGAAGAPGRDQDAVRGELA
jgi:crotonobetainyl-CoA:carnitine CoA-transferase CaiB-like acyl-CoA transferase